jgi:hypothetical protein
MSYRRHPNSHDNWIRFRDENSIVFEEVGIPRDVLSSETRLAEFLTSGRDAETNFALDSLADEQFWQLYRLVTSRFDMQAATFAACEARRLHSRSGG